MLAAATAAALGISVVVVLALRTVPAAGSASPPVAYGFDGHSGWHGGQIRPHEIAFGAGGSLIARQVSWTTWKRGEARGHGTVLADGCSPNCAQGSYTRSAATLTLSAPRRHDGHAYFSKLVMTWTQGGRTQSGTYHWSVYPGGSVPFWH
jgi:hypothetical protein